MSHYDTFHEYLIETIDRLFTPHFRHYNTSPDGEVPVLVGAEDLEGFEHVYKTTVEEVKVVVDGVRFSVELLVEKDGWQRTLNYVFQGEDVDVDSRTFNRYTRNMAAGLMVGFENLLTFNGQPEREIPALEVLVRRPLNDSERLELWLNKEYLRLRSTTFNFAFKMEGEIP